MNQPFIYLASSSPRRRELLAQIGVSYRVHAVDIDERPRSGEAAADLATRLAGEKAQTAAAELGPTVPVLAADTVVIIDGEPIGKPADRADAMAMLARLSGRRHQVTTAVATVHGGRLRCASSETEVLFRDIAPAESAAYWDTGEPLDKAGGYAIQGLGAVFVSRIAGSYSSVMGLPLFETARLLQDTGITVLRTAAD